MKIGVESARANLPARLAIHLAARPGGEHEPGGRPESGRPAGMIVGRAFRCACPRTIGGAAAGNRRKTVTAQRQPACAPPLLVAQGGACGPRRFRSSAALSPPAALGGLVVRPQLAPQSRPRHRRPRLAPCSRACRPAARRPHLGRSPGLNITVRAILHHGARAVVLQAIASCQRRRSSRLFRRACRPLPPHAPGPPPCAPAAMPLARGTFYR